MKEAAAWLRERLERGARPLLPARPGPACTARRAAARAAGAGAARRWRCAPLAVEPPDVSLAHMALRFPPVSQFLERFRAVLRRRRRFDFDARGGRALACRAGGRVPRAARAAQGRRDHDRPGRAVRADSRGRGPRRGSGPRRKDACVDRPLRLIADEPARRARAHARGAARRRLAASVGRGARRRGRRRPRAGRGPRSGCSAERYGEGRSGIVLEHVAGGCAFRASREAAEACARLFERPVERGLSQAALETLAIVAYLGPAQPPGHRADPRRRRRLGRRRPRRAGADRRGRARREGGAVRYRTTPLFERVFGLESLSELPRLDDLGGSTEEIRDRLEAIAERRPA